MRAAEPLVDSWAREIEDLRISLTDRCNFRCLYCLPETPEAFQFLRRFSNVPSSPSGQHWKRPEELLTFEEITEVARAFVGMGVRKLRLTGGEPLLRTEAERLVGMLARLDGVEDLAMTSNGFLFPGKADALKEAGLRRMSFSLDSLDESNFKRITGRAGLGRVLRSVERAQELGLAPVKVNCVLIRGLNDHEIESLVDYGVRQKVHVRFIEYMPLDANRGWSRAMVVPKEEILERVSRRWKLEAMVPDHAAETARRWRVGDSESQLGLIAPVSEPFCGNCNRVRLTADGAIRTCLFSLQEHDVKQVLRSNVGSEALHARIREIVWQKEAGHRIGKPDFQQPERTMSCIGG